MLHLKAPTAPEWLQRVQGNLDELLIDHAHCEKKAAGTAMNLLFAYVEQVPLVRCLADIVREELEHFEQVLDLLAARGVRFRGLKPTSYARRLHQQVRKTEPQRAVDRLLVAGLIEARSCERFDLLRRQIQDDQLRTFYDSLFESEARHHATYVQLAACFAPRHEVLHRLDQLARIEAHILQQVEPWVRMHS